MTAVARVEPAHGSRMRWAAGTREERHKGSMACHRKGLMQRRANQGECIIEADEIFNKGRGERRILPSRERKCARAAVAQNQLAELRAVHSAAETQMSGHSSLMHHREGPLQRPPRMCRC